MKQHEESGELTHLSQITIVCASKENQITHYRFHLVDLDVDDYFHWKRQHAEFIEAVDYLVRADTSCTVPEIVGKAKTGKYHAINRFEEPVKNVFNIYSFDFETLLGILKFRLSVLREQRDNETGINQLFRKEKQHEI